VQVLEREQRVERRHVPRAKRRGQKSTDRQRRDVGCEPLADIREALRPPDGPNPLDSTI